MSRRPLINPNCETKLLISEVVCVRAPAPVHWNSQDGGRSPTNLGPPRILRRFRATATHWLGGCRDGGQVSSSLAHQISDESLSLCSSLIPLPEHPWCLGTLAQTLAKFKDNDILWFTNVQKYTSSQQTVMMIAPCRNKK